VRGPKKGHALMAVQCSKVRAFSSKNHMYMHGVPQRECPRAATLERRAGEREGVASGGKLPCYITVLRGVLS
jgi:hypothetical protein